MKQIALALGVAAMLSVVILEIDTRMSDIEYCKDHPKRSRSITCSKWFRSIYYRYIKQ